MPSAKNFEFKRTDYLLPKEFYCTPFVLDKDTIATIVRGEDPSPLIVAKSDGNRWGTIF